MDMDKKLGLISNIILVLLGVSVCVSEPFSRHCVKAVLFLQ